MSCWTARPLRWNASTPTPCCDDDLPSPAMDDDDLRRGQPTVPGRFDEGTAILAGDALQTLAFSILADHPMPGQVMANRVKMLEPPWHAPRAISACAAARRWIWRPRAAGSPWPSWSRCTAARQGALIPSAPSPRGLCKADVEPATLAALQTYAAAIGLAFQVRDDILDITGGTATLGKPQGSDLAQGRAPPALLGLDNARELARGLR